jgi:hypothetical protein
MKNSGQRDIASRTGMVIAIGRNLSSIVRGAAREYRLWREARELMAMDSSILSDLAVPRGGIEGMVRYGRDRDGTAVASAIVVAEAVITNAPPPIRGRREALTPMAAADARAAAAE